MHLAALAAPHYYLSDGPSYTLDHQPFGMPIYASRGLGLNASDARRLAPILATTEVRQNPKAVLLNSASVVADHAMAVSEANCSTPSTGFNISVALQTRTIGGSVEVDSYVGVELDSFEVIRARVLGLQCGRARILAARLAGDFEASPTQVGPRSDRVALDIACELGLIPPPQLALADEPL